MTFDQQYAIIVQLLQWYVFQWLALYTLYYMSNPPKQRSPLLCV